MGTLRLRTTQHDLNGGIRPVNPIFRMAAEALTRYMPDELYLKMMYRRSTGRPLNLRNPRTFSEKLQWLKLHDHKPDYAMMVDKYEVRKFIAQTIGEQYLIPLLGVWDGVEQMDIRPLPGQFVLKCTHDSGSIVLCRDKASFDLPSAKAKLGARLERNFFAISRERPYKNLKPRIIAERYMADGSGAELKDYKWYCFGGKPRICQVIADRSTRQTIDFFDLEWNHLPLTGLHRPGHAYPHATQRCPKPGQFERMKAFAEKLARGTAYVRIDFYEISDALYWGEFTLYPASGFGLFEPDEWNDALGNWIDLPV
jgi:hypothetical protein